MCVKFIFVICYVLVKIASAASVYDQSQTGNLNVLIDFKDLQVIALTKSAKEEYVDYDYAYDYSEMTIKPQNGTTPKPLNATTGPGPASADLHDNTTVAATSLIETTTDSIKSTTGKPPDSSMATEIAVGVASTTLRTVKYNNTKQTTRKYAANITIPNNNNCTRGFVLCDSQNQNKPLSILELLSQRFKRRDHRKDAEEKQ